MMDGIRGFAMSIIANKLPQNQKQNPMAQTMIQAIQNGDNVAGEQLANNILKTYGMTKEQALNQAISFFGLDNSR